MSTPPDGPDQPRPDQPRPDQPRPASARVRVSGPARPGNRSRATRTEQIDAGTPVGEVYLRSLLREQLGLGLRTVATVAVVVGSLPLVFFLIPRLAEVRVGGIGLSWLLLGGVVYPFLVALGWWHVCRAEANERAFVELVAEEGERR